MHTLYWCSEIINFFFSVPLGVFYYARTYSHVFRRSAWLDGDKSIEPLRFLRKFVEIKLHTTFPRSYCFIKRDDDSSAGALRLAPRLGVTRPGVQVLSGGQTHIHQIGLIFSTRRDTNFVLCQRRCKSRYTELM